MKTLKTAALAVMAALVLLAAGSAMAQQKRYGEAIDPKAPKVTLAQLVAKPEAYAGKMVVVEGMHGGACADGADFYFKDKFDIIEVDPPSATPDVVQLKKGTHVRVYGIVKVRHSSSEAAEKGEKKEAGEAGSESRRRESKCNEPLHAQPEGPAAQAGPLTADRDGRGSGNRGAVQPSLLQHGI